LRRVLSKNRVTRLETTARTKEKDEIIKRDYFYPLEKENHLTTEEGGTKKVDHFLRVN